MEDRSVLDEDGFDYDQTWLGFPYIYVMVTGVLQAIPGELYEAAKIDGATFIQRFKHITLPMIFICDRTGDDYPVYI